jgi:hypothetical protein
MYIHMCTYMSVVCGKVEFSVSGWSLVQRSLAECGVSECDRAALIIRRLWPTGGCCAIDICCVHGFLDGEGIMKTF